MNDNGTQKERTILFAGYAASNAAAALAASCREKLKNRYSADFIRSAIHLSYSDEEILLAASAYKRGETEAFTTQREGLLTALWEMGEYYGSGFSINMKKIPLRQETVEVCEYLELDPFSLPSSGCILFVTDHPESLKEHLQDYGIKTAIIGSMKGTKARTLHYGERVRYLDKPVRK